MTPFSLANSPLSHSAASEVLGGPVQDNIDGIAGLVVGSGCEFSAPAFRRLFRASGVLSRGR